jgi:hypothetical protein
VVLLPDSVAGVPAVLEVGVAVSVVLDDAGSVWATNVLAPVDWFLGAVERLGCATKCDRCRLVAPLEVLVEVVFRSLVLRARGVRLERSAGLVVPMPGRIDALARSAAPVELAPTPALEAPVWRVSGDALNRESATTPHPTTTSITAATLTASDATRGRPSVGVGIGSGPGRTACI